MYMCIQSHIHTIIYSHIYTSYSHIYIQSYIVIYSHIQSYIVIYSHTQSYIVIYSPLYIYICIHMYIYMYKYIYIQSHIQSYMVACSHYICIQNGIVILNRTQGTQICSDMYPLVFSNMGNFPSICRGFRKSPWMTAKERIPKTWTQPFAPVWTTGARKSCAKPQRCTV